MKKLLTLIAVFLYSSVAVFGQTNDDKQVKPPNGLDERSAYYLFYSDFQNENYKSALNNGRWILKTLPRKIKGFSSYDLPTNLDRFITIYSDMAQKATDPSLKSAYIDTANSIFDKAFTTFSKDEIDYYQWHINWGRFYQQNEDFIDNAKAKETAEYKKAFELNSDKMVEGKGYYVRVLLNNLVAKGGDESKQEALAIIKQVEDEAQEDLDSYFDGIRNKLFDSPDERMVFLEKKLKETPDDQKVIRQLRDIYEDQDMISKAQKLNKKLYEQDPSYQNTTALANFAIQNANYNDAIKYLNEAKNKTDETAKLKSIYLNLSNAYLNKGRLRQARTYARKAIHSDPNWGRPYLKLADIYARAVSDCTAGRDLKRGDRAVYWLVIDYLNKAKRIDSSISASANNRLRSYRPVAPTKEDVFMSDNWDKGASIRIDSSMGSCYSWINESTTVR